VKLLRQTIEEAKIKNIHIHYLAAGDKPGMTAIQEVDLEVGTNFGGVSLTGAIKEQPDAPYASVIVKRIDDIVAGDQVSFIKADVEGYEDRVLAGARETIVRCKPILFVECDHPATDTDKLRKFIEDLGYATERIGGNFMGLPL
jgi:FkbM family methyltransferase